MYLKITPSRILNMCKNLPVCTVQIENDFFYNFCLDMNISHFEPWCSLHFTPCCLVEHVILKKEVRFENGTLLFSRTCRSEKKMRFENGTFFKE